MNIKPFLLLTILFISCRQKNEEKKPPKEDWEIRNERREELEIKNQKSALFLATKQNAIVGWDSTEYFSYELQEMLSNKSLSFIGTVNDIIKKDSGYVLNVFSSNGKSSDDYIAEIFVSPSMFQELKFRFKSKDEMREGCFILKVNSIQSLYPKLTSEVETNGESAEDASSYLTFRFHETLIKFKGNLIDFYIFKEVDDEE